MPTATFFNLPESKREKIIQASKKEFSRANIVEASIKNIVEDAQIARGSFYQYFEDKQDLYEYLLEEQLNEVIKRMKQDLTKNKGDIFFSVLSAYDYIIEAATNKENVNFYKKVFENMKAGEDNSIFSIKMKEEDCHVHKNDFSNLIDTSNLNIKNEEEKDIIVQMIIPVVRTSIIHVIKNNCKNREKERENFIKKIEYLKYGILKK